MTIDPNLVLGVVSLALFVAMIAFFAFLIRHQNEVEPEERPVEGVELLRQHYGAGDTVEQPTPYYVAPIPASPDPLEISANLDKKIVLGAFMLFATFALIGGYLFTLLVVRADASGGTWHDRVAEAKQLQQDVDRGRNLYANFCFDCHGKEGRGDVGVGLPLNSDKFKYDKISGDPAKLKDTELLLERTIERGRAKPAPQISMPAWADTEGGPLNDEQIRQLMAFIEHAGDAEWADIVTVRRELGLSDVPNPPKPVVLSPQDAGKALMQSNPQTPCITCHSIIAGQNSPVAAAPNLGRYGAEGPFNDELKALKASGDPDWLFKWVSNAPSIKPGIIMPAFNTSAGGQLSDENIRNIVAFLTSLGK